MKQPCIVIISGAPGSGKSSVACALSENSAYEHTILLRIDDFFSYIRKGYIEPWLPDSHEQNIALAHTLAATAKSLAAYSYGVFVDGVIGPWLLDPWMRAAHAGINVHYLILRPSLEETISRGVNRTGAKDLVDPNVIKKMWEEFSDLGLYEPYVVDTTGQNVTESVAFIRSRIDKGCYRLL